MDMNEKKCKDNTCENHEGICCMFCPDLMTCTAPCESGNYEEQTCDDNKLEK